MTSRDFIFLTRYSLSIVLPAAFAVGMISASGQTGPRTGPYAALVTLLSLPVFCAVGQWFVTRNMLAHPVLWGAATGGGLVAAAFAIALAQQFDELWRPVVWQLAFWLWGGLGLVGVPSAFVAHAAAGIVFGLVLGGTQTLALAFHWLGRVQWLAVSTAAALLVALIVYIFGEIGVIGYLLWTPYREVWTMALARAGLAVLLCGCFALPTGLCMSRLSRQFESAKDAVVLRLFE